MKFLKAAAAAGLVAATFTGTALAQGKPQEIKIGITTFLSGPASVFGVPAKAAAEMIAEDINKKGGIGGVPVKLSFIDEGAGGEALVSNYRRVVRTIDDLAASLGTSREALGAKLDAEIALDPLVLAPYVDAERVLMIITRTDAIIPFEAQQQLRTGMGSPETMYLMTGHRTSVVYFLKLRSAAFEFFERHFAADHIALAMR